MITETRNTYVSNFLRDLSAAVAAANNLEDIFQNPALSSDLKKMAESLVPQYENGSFNADKTKEYTYPMHEEVRKCFNAMAENLDSYAGKSKLNEEFNRIESAMNNEAFASCGTKAQHGAHVQKNSAVSNMLRLSVPSASSNTDAIKADRKMHFFANVGGLK